MHAERDCPPPLPLFVPYSPECVEVEFSEVASCTYLCYFVGTSLSSVTARERRTRYGMVPGRNLLRELSL